MPFVGGGGKLLSVKGGLDLGQHIGGGIVVEPRYAAARDDQHKKHDQQQPAQHAGHTAPKLLGKGVRRLLLGVLLSAVRFGGRRIGGILGGGVCQPGHDLGDGKLCRAGDGVRTGLFLGGVLLCGILLRGILRCIGRTLACIGCRLLRLCGGSIFRGSIFRGGLDCRCFIGAGIRQGCLGRLCRFRLLGSLGLCRGRFRCCFRGFRQRHRDGIWLRGVRGLGHLQGCRCSFCGGLRGIAHSWLLLRLCRGGGLFGLAFGR